MYHEEKIIDGVLHHRNHPQAQWKAYTIEQLTNKVEALKFKLSKQEPEMCY